MLVVEFGVHVEVEGGCSREERRPSQVEEQHSLMEDYLEQGDQRFLGAEELGLFAEAEEEEEGYSGEERVSSRREE